MSHPDLQHVKTVHFIGVGGIGISAVARMMRGEGKKVSGSDKTTSRVTDELAALGVTIFSDHQAEHLPADVDLVIYSIAVPEDNPELVVARTWGIPTLTYPQVLGLVSADKYTIAVAGTHGKTTTTAMLGQIFLDAGLEPTVIVGSFLKDQRSNFIAGRGKYLIVEACEYQRSFLNLMPRALIITNIDRDHLDYYRDLADIQEAFCALVAKIPADGVLVCDPRDQNLLPIIKTAHCQVIDYQNVFGSPVSKMELAVPGEHNQKNARAAAALAQGLGVAESVVGEALAGFLGTWRRFDLQGVLPVGARIYDDYAHHPAEIGATLAAAREIAPTGKVIVAFQPHLFSRTKLLLDDFATSLTQADLVLVPDIYAAREAADGTITALTLVKKINLLGGRAEYLPDFSAIAARLVAEASARDVVLTMGAGDIARVNAFLPLLPERPVS